MKHIAFDILSLLELQNKLYLWPCTFIVKIMNSGSWFWIWCRLPLKTPSLNLKLWQFPELWDVWKLCLLWLTNVPSILQFYYHNCCITVWNLMWWWLLKHNSIVVLTLGTFLHEHGHEQFLLLLHVTHPYSDI